MQSCLFGWATVLLVLFDITVQSSMLRWGTVQSCLFRSDNAEFSVGMCVDRQESNFCYTFEIHWWLLCDRFIFESITKVRRGTSQIWSFMVHWVSVFWGCLERKRYFSDNVSEGNAKITSERGSGLFWAGFGSHWGAFGSFGEALGAFPLLAPSLPPLYI